MRSLAVDFRSPGSPPRWAWVITALLALTATSLVYSAWLQQRAVNHLRAQRDATLSKRQASVQSRTDATVQRPPYEASARELLAEATSEWPAMLTALESVAIVGVTPVSIEIVSLERQIRVDVEFSDYATLLRYLDDLNAGERPPRWQLLQAQVTPRGASGASVATPALATLIGRW